MFTIILATALAALATATSTQLARRAGAPIPKPIPPNCTIADPVLCTSAQDCPPVSYTQYRPTPSTLASPPFLYGYYLNQPATGSASSLFQTCLETCYGYGNTGDCLAVYQAYNYPSPPMFGGPGGDLTVACLLFDRWLGEGDFEVVPEGERANWTEPVSGNIVCPEEGASSLV